MEKCCKNCKKFSSCNYFLPFPERGCIEFESKKIVDVFTGVPSHENFSFVKTLIQGRCYASGVNPELLIKEKRLFGIFYHNSQTGHSKVLNIFDDEKLAYAELNELRDSICKRPSSCIYIDVRPCSLSYSKFLADDVLISIVNAVAQDLLIAERGFKKGCFNKKTFEKSKRWFEFAYSACRRGAAILDVVNHD